MRWSALGVAFLLCLVAACDGPISFERDHPHDLENPRFAPMFAPGKDSVLVDGRIIIRWQDKSVREEGFVVQRSTDGRPFVEIARVGVNTTQATVRATAHEEIVHRVCSLYDGEARGCEVVDTLDFTTHLSHRSLSNREERFFYEKEDFFYEEIQPLSEDRIVAVRSDSTLLKHVASWEATWTAGPPNTTIVISTVTLKDGSLLSIGESALSDGLEVTRFNPETQIWSEVALIEFEGGRVTRLRATRLLDGSVLLTGFQQSSAQRFAIRFDPTSGTYGEITSPPFVPYSLNTLEGGGVLAIGYKKGAAIFEPNVKAWQPANLPDFSDMYSLQVIQMGNGRLFVATNLEGMFVYDPVRNDYASVEVPPGLGVRQLIAISGNRVYAGHLRKRLLRGAEYLGYEYILYVYDGDAERWKTYTAPGWTKKTWGGGYSLGRPFWTDGTRVLVCSRPGCLWVRPPEE